ncbi:tripartite tricarboxylate transporter substrate binding protein [Bosea sp. SSUT16]|jgi:tripartite-type tricarboxylate transporter receptor subunit TctC|uniref:Tripartite tricarboxylate transporter substrate binding protein n=1 Tax=Bosea spartocytisi TaxID=2773451 RepID=A0A927I1X2_9HYPH|nr:tripartite tricarboxylate transporter substrate-binding protein [Bosea spartocytisi]MBD3848111.1 tripartite tricarboxylate transporter substrate binding protein [Bosea spartocytisi]MCT4473962.1 tripartite tricarboxylate transporter substrate-binding protein [Bosea spartocytisi]
MKRLVSALIGAAIGLCATAPAGAQSYPSRNVTIVVPFAAGSGSDTAARVLGQHLAARLKQNFIIENRAGATGAIATAAVAKAAPDGYTLLLGTNSTHGSNSALYKKLAYDPIKDFAPIAHTGVFSYFLVLDPKLPIKSVADLIAAAKAKPGEISYAGGSSTSIVMAESFAKGAGISFLKVPYRSNPPALTDVIGGRINMMFCDMSSAIGSVNSGSLRAIAVTTKNRSTLAPDLPTIAETAVKDFDLASWTGLFAPAGTPNEIVERLNTEVNAILALPDVKERFAPLGIEAQPVSAAEFTRYVQSEVVKWAALVKEAGIEPE